MMNVSRLLWVGVGVVAIADIATTYVGLQLGLVEANPLVDHVVHDVGVAGMVAVKMAAVGIAAIGWRTVPREYRLIVPVCLGVPWVIASTVNAVLVLQVLS